jgi:cellulase/cellobiase CelA1
VEYLANGVWQAAPMNGDIGQSYIIGGTTAGANEFQIRVRDSNDTLINNGRIYSFTLPAVCGSSCPTPYTQVSYTSTPTPPSPSPSQSASASPSASPSPSPSMSATSPPGKACTASYTITGQWSGNFQGEVAVRNTGTSPLASWTVRWSYANGQTVTQLWNGTLGSNGPAVTISNASYNGTVAPNTSTTFGFLGSWSTTNSVPGPTCTAT